MAEFLDVYKDRRSATKFIPDIQITDKELDEIFNLVKLAPSAFNLQHVHYVVVNDTEGKQKMYEASGKQYKVLTSSAVIVVLGNTHAHQHTAEIYEGMFNLGILSKQEYDQTVSSTIQFYQDRGEIFQKEEAIRNASLSAMALMLIAKEKGWDTCPMIGFDPVQVANELDIPDTHVPVMMITLGKEDTSSQRPRGYRKPVAEFVSYHQFQSN